MNSDGELRRPLMTALDRLTNDLVIGRHGDPHVAFMVFVYPDRQPAIVAVTPRGTGDLSRILAAKDNDRDGHKDRFFTYDELAEAAGAMKSAEIGVMISGGGFRVAKTEPGVVIGEQIRKDWERRRSYPIERALQQAQLEADRPAKCPHCSQRFTERGLPMHLRKSRLCSRKAALAASEGSLNVVQDENPR